MFIERRLNQSNNVIELWSCRWENRKGSPARKVDIEKICDEKQGRGDIGDDLSEKVAICWASERTLGNIAVQSPTLLGRFPGREGNDATLPCDFGGAGKFRNGAERLWCRTHQTHWGTKADLRSYEQLAEMRCANWEQPMHYVVEPLTIDLDEYAAVGIWCSMPAALSTVEIKRRPPKIHVHVRKNAEDKKTIDRDFNAVSLRYRTNSGMFASEEITRVNITPPAAFDFVYALEFGQKMSCIACSKCGYPHLDLADFARKPHRKHFCGNCGRDSTWSREPIVSTPLKPLHDRVATDSNVKTPERTLNLDAYPGCSYTVWASTPAIVWTASRPQEFGIHVHVHDGSTRIVDDTFGEVVLDGKPLERAGLIEAMIAQSIT